MKSKRHRPTVKIFRTPKGKSEKSLLNSGNIAAAAAVVAGVVVDVDGGAAALADATLAELLGRRGENEVVDSHPKTHDINLGNPLCLFRGTYFARELWTLGENTRHTRC